MLADCVAYNLKYFHNNDNINHELTYHLLYHQSSNTNYQNLDGLFALKQYKVSRFKVDESTAAVRVTVTEPRVSRHSALDRLCCLNLLA